MIPLILTAEEVRAALAGTLTEIRRPVDPQPSAQTTIVEWNTAEKAFVPWRWSSGGSYAGGSRTGRPFQCPFGGSGAVLFVQESWRAWQRTCAEDDAHHYDDDWQAGRVTCGPHCRQTYVAFEATPRQGYRPHPDRAVITYLVETTPLWSNRQLLGPWESASLMPDWASRLALRNRGVQAERIEGAWTWVLNPERVNRPNGAPMPPAEIGGGQ